MKMSFRFKFISTVILLKLFCFLGIDVSAADFSIGKIGYGSSTAVITSKIQEGFFMGFELGFRKVLGVERASHLLITDQISNNSQLAAIQSANELINQNVVALFGFPGSNDA